MVARVAGRQCTGNGDNQDNRWRKTHLKLLPLAVCGNATTCHEVPPWASHVGGSNEQYKCKFRRWACPTSREFPACLTRNSREPIDRIFVRIFGMNRLAARKLELAACYTHTLLAVSRQMHFDPTECGIPHCLMRKSG